MVNMSLRLEKARNKTIPVKIFLSDSIQKVISLFVQKVEKTFVLWAVN